MPAKILVVEDNDDARTLWLLVLEGEGYDVITACDGQEGLEAAIAEKPDLVLTDISMLALYSHPGRSSCASTQRQHLTVGA